MTHERHTALIRFLFPILKAVGCGLVVLAMTTASPAANPESATTPPAKNPAPAAAKPAPQEHHAPTAPLRNQHLKGVASHTETVTAHKLARFDAHHVWVRRWDYHTWIAVHRGLGTIRGTIYNPGGQPAASVRVALRQPGGHPFANVALRHITFTDAAGNFVMFGVRTGGYRVFAKQGKQHAHVQTAVHPGGLATVTVAI